MPPRKFPGPKEIAPPPLRKSGDPPAPAPWVRECAAAENPRAPGKCAAAEIPLAPGNCAACPEGIPRSRFPNFNPLRFRSREALTAQLKKVRKKSAFGFLKDPDRETAGFGNGWRGLRTVCVTGTRLTTLFALVSVRSRD